MERRKFIQVSGLCMLAPSLVIPEAKATPGYVSSRNAIMEKRREVPVKGYYDVIVCGAGPAGIAAAIEAARRGASVLLVEVHGCLGGVWTSGLLSWILDYKNKTGLLKQIADDLMSRGAITSIPTNSSLPFDPEQMKLLLEEYCLDARVNVRLYTRVVGVHKEKNRVTHIITESGSGREGWYGKMFIDATGDGDLAALAGCSFDYGDPEDGSAQPSSLLAVIGGIHFDEIKEYVRWKGDYQSASKKRLLTLIEKGGHSPSYRQPSIFPIQNDLFMIMVNHEYGCKGSDTDLLTQSTLNARREINLVINAIKANGNEWKDIRLIATAEQIGIREGRRIHGLYTVTLQDLIEGRTHDDAVCKVTFGIDVHSVALEHESGKSYSRGYKSKPYDIPLRALIAKDVQGLMMAGRCISGDFLAHSSYRVTGNSVSIGEAAGKVSAFAALNNILPQNTPKEEFQ